MERITVSLHTAWQLLCIWHFVHKLWWSQIWNTLIFLPLRGCRTSCKHRTDKLSPYKVVKVDRVGTALVIPHERFLYFCLNSSHWFEVDVSGVGGEEKKKVMSHISVHHSLGTFELKCNNSRGGLFVYIASAANQIWWNPTHAVHDEADYLCFWVLNS